MNENSRLGVFEHGSAVDNELLMLEVLDSIPARGTNFLYPTQ